MSRIHNELSQVIVTVTPFDSANEPTTPTTARYRIDDCRSEKELVDWTALTPSTSMTITIPGSVNKIINSDRQTPEAKVVTVHIDKDLTTEHFEEYIYRVQDKSFAQVA